MRVAARRTARQRPALVVTVTVRGRHRVGRGLASWLASAAPKSARGMLDIAIVSDVEMRRLNREFRRVDTSTDVLSFPSESRAGISHVGTGLRGVPYLGDLAIAVGVARRQAAEQRHSLAVELKVLALHGLLHLLGYDHEADDGQMRRLEERLRHQAGLPSGLIARVPGRPTRA
jgi:probable rRNA maturation factor